MRALIRKHPINAGSDIESQIWFEDTWREDWESYTDEIMHYALCSDIPDEPDFDENGNDRRMDLNNYVVEEHTEETDSDEGPVTRRYWTATYQVIQ